VSYPKWLASREAGLDLRIGMIMEKKIFLYGWMKTIFLFARYATMHQNK